MSKTVLITGAAGYIGRHVVKEFLNHGYTVIANDFQFKGVDERAVYNRVSIFGNDEDIYEKLGSPDMLVHLAWRDGFIHNSPAHMEDLSLHVHFLQKMIDSNISSISVMGSMHEIGYWEGEVRNDTPCNPQSMYGIAKNALRQTLLLYASDRITEVRWLRGFYIYGDDSKGSSVFAKIVQAAEDGEHEFPFTSGKNKYDFIQLRELAHLIYLATIQNEYSGIINVCSGTATELGIQIENFIMDKGLDINLAYGKYPDRPYDSPAIWGDATIINDIRRKYEDT